MNNKIKETKINGKCVNCENNSLIYREIIYDIPNFGKYLLYSIQCEKCNFTIKESLPLEKKEKKHFKVILFNERALNSIFVRGEDCQIYFENLDLFIDPIRGDPYITTLEGLLHRIESVLKIMGDKKILEKFEDLKKFKEPLVFVFKDNSGISEVIEKKGNIKIEEIKD